MSTDAVKDLARSLLYEGYALWPYRRSAAKHRKQWTFGGVYPRTWSQRGHADDPWMCEAECLVQPLLGAGNPSVDVTLRYLQNIVVRRESPAGDLVAAATTGGHTGPTEWDEAIEREVSLLDVELTEPPRRATIGIEGGAELGWFGEGARMARLRRSWGAMSGEVDVDVLPADSAYRIRIRVANHTRCSATVRERMLSAAFVSTHLQLRARGARFVSLSDPPAGLRAAAAACRNQGWWPILVGDAGSSDHLLISPINLQDYPAIAPEIPADVFDRGAIDELLVLNILSLTDEDTGGSDMTQ